MNLTCPNCGNSISIDDNFCSKCRFDLSKTKKTRSESSTKKKSESKSENNARVYGESKDNAKIYKEQIPSDVYVPDRGIWQKFFRMSGRLNPARFLFRTALVLTMAFLLLVLLAFLPLSNKTSETLFLAVNLAAGIFMIPLMIRRAHDFGRPWWYCFVGGIPILAGFFELIFQKVVYRDSDGDYHETHRFNEAGVVFSFFYIIIAGILAALYFTFRSGDPGENEYGANPAGNKRADIPVETNPILAVISKAEEHEFSSLIIAVAVVGSVFGTSALSQFLVNMQHATPKDVADNLKQVVSTGEISTQAEKVSPEQSSNPASNQSEILSNPLTSENQRKAVETLISFHQGITQRNFYHAYDQFSSQLQSEIAYDGWASGFATTVSSSVSRVNVVSETPSEIFLNYILTAVDNVQGQEKVARFNGTVKIINENGVWKIDDIKNKVL